MTPSTLPFVGALIFAGSLLLAGCEARSPNATAAASAPAAAPADIAQRLRKLLAERIPKLPPIDEVRASPVPGLYEVRFGGAEIIYVDATGQFLIQGALIDTRTLANLTEERIEQITAVPFDKLPLKDALVIKQGQGERKLAVFADPNCGYCKRFERDLAKIDNVTVYTFLMPILGPDSQTKSRDIWCAADPAKAWRAWMIDGQLPARAAPDCDGKALDRNVAFGREHRINGTPALLFEDNTRKGGALPLEMVQRLLDKAAKKS